MGSMQCVWRKSELNISSECDNWKRTCQPIEHHLPKFIHDEANIILDRIMANIRNLEILHNNLPFWISYQNHWRFLLEERKRQNGNGRGGVASS